jgi:ABC-2 type transport system permease protein
MPSRTSLLNPEILKLILRSSGWISIIYFLVLLFAIPFEILMTTSDKRLMFEPANVFQYNLELQYILLVSVPVILPLFLFHFMQSKQSSDLIHSLPVKRDMIFHQYTLSGWFMVNIPVVVIAIIVFVQRSVLNIQSILEMDSIFYWLGMTILFNTIIYISTVFIGMITGISFVQGILSYIFLLLPVGLFVLSAFNLKFFMFGFPDSYHLNGKIKYLSPLTMLEGIQDIPNRLPLWIYVGISILLYFLSSLLYKNRKPESVSQAVIFPILKPILKFGMTVCCALLAAAYFGSYRELSEGWLFFGYLFGSFFGYVLAEILLHKTWRVFGYLKGYLYYGGILVVIIAIFQFDLTNFEDRIPEMEEIQQVHLSNGPYLYLNPEESGYSKETFYLNEKNNIQLVRELHEQILSNKNNKKVSSELSESAFFVYELKNGKKLVREYEINRDDYLAYYKPIHESKEYKEVTFPLFNLTSDEINMITIESSGYKNDRAVISERAEITELLAIIKEDILSSTYEEMYSSKSFQSHISFSLNNSKEGKEYYGYADTRALVSYKRMQDWLEGKDLLDNAFISEDDIDFAVVLKKEDLKLNHDGYSNIEVLTNMNNHPSATTFKSKDQIKELMDITEDAYIPDSKETYVVAYKIKNQLDPYLGTFDQNEAPVYVNDKFK